MGHLNELHEKFAERGLTILAISQQPRSAVEAYVEELEVAFPTVCESSDSMAAYGCTGFPSGFLIDTGGRIVWEGHPSGLTEALIEEHLEKARILPAWPDALKDVRREFEKDDFADALEKAEKHLERDRLEEAERADAEKIRDWLLWYGASRLEAADADVEAGRYYEASLAFEEVEDLYKGHDLEKQAEARLDELLSDKDRKLEVKAGEKLAKILEETRGESAKKKLRALRPLLSRKYEETAAGRKAAEMSAALEEEEE